MSGDKCRYISDTKHHDNSDTKHHDNSDIQRHDNSDIQHRDNSDIQHRYGSDTKRPYGSDIQRHDVIECLTANRYIGGPAFKHYHGRSCDTVIIRGH